MVRAATYWAEYLRRQGVRYAFGQGGLEAVELLEALRAAGIEFVWTHHEGAAAFAAAALGELTGLPGLCVATRGPGATNLLTGVAHAWLDRAPLLAVSGDTDPALKASLPHQELPLVDVFAPVAKRALTLTADNLTAELPRAFDLAVDLPCGPVYLAFPQSEARRPVALGPEPAAAPAVPWGASAALGNAVEVINAARRPILYVGLGVHHTAWERDLLNLAERIGGPVVVTPKAKGYFPEDHPRFAGVYQAYQDAPVKELFRQADLVVGVGLDSVEMAKPWEFAAPVVNVAVRPESAYFPDLLPVPANGDTGIRPLVERVSVRSAWPADAVALARRAVASLLQPGWRGEAPRGLTPQAVLGELRALLRPEAIVACDVGSHRQLTAQIWPTYWPRTFLTSNGLSSVGYALPAALAAKLACPDRQVVCLVGDGGLLMFPGELQTLARLGLGVVVVVWADFGSSSTRLEHERSGYPAQGGTFGGDADFAVLARSFGVWATTIERPAEIGAKLRAALAQPGPALVQVPIEYDVYRGMEL